MKKSRAILSIFLVIWMIVLLSVASYSWVARNWTPSLTHNKIAITTSGSLMMEIDSSLYNSVDLSDGYYEEGFNFSQVSTCNGTKFFAANFASENPYYTELADTDTGRYINFDFVLRTQASAGGTDDGKYVFIHPDTWISDKYDDASYTGSEPSARPAKAIRIAITVKDSMGNYVTTILSRSSSQQFVNGQLVDLNSTVVDAAASDANRKPIYTDYTGTAGQNYTINTESHEKQTAQGLHYYHGGRTSYDGNADNDRTNDYDFTLDTSRVLFTIDPGESKEVNVKIWLEGGDSNCTDAISKEVVGVILKFDAVDISASTN